MLTSVLAALLAGIPGLYALASGRTLVRRLDDPIVNELFFQRSQRLTQIAIVTMVLLVVAKSTWAPALIPLSILGLLVGSFPSRRLLFEESWSLGAYLTHTLRLMLAMYGPWLLLLAGLAAVLRWDAVALPVGAALVVALAAWGVWGGPLMLRTFRAVALADSELREAFEPVLAAATCPRPDLRVTKADGGHWANAFAVPRLNTGAVLFTAELLKVLDVEEATGILAHELAHLEEFQNGRWLRRSLFPAALGSGAVALLLVAQSFAPWVTWTVPIAILVTLVIVGGRSQKRESDSDARAIELTGDPDALVRALSKIHHRARLPRRMDAQIEKRLTHPSLARRIQAIRRDFEPDREALSFANDPDQLLPLRLDTIAPASTVLYLDEDRVRCFENVEEGSDRSLDSLVQTAVQRSHPYSTLRELRVEVRGGKRFLTLRDGTAPKPTRFRINDADVAGLQKLLDRIDGQLGTPVAGVGSGLYPLLARFMALVGILLGLGVGYSGFAAVCIVAAVVPRRSTLVGAGVAAALTFAGVALGLRESIPLIGYLPWTAAPLAVIALLFVGTAVLLGRQDGDAHNEDHPTAALAALGLIAVAMVFVQLGSVPSSSVPMGLHLWARRAPDALVMLAGTGAGLLLLTRTRARVGGTLAVLATVVLATTGHTFFRTSSGDLLSAIPPAFAATPVTAELVRTVVVEGDLSTVRVDRRTGRLLVASGVEGGGGAVRYRVETDDGFRDVDADQAAWSASGDLIGLRIRDQVVFAENPAGQVRMEAELPGLVEPTLVVRGDAWAVTDSDIGAAVLRVHRGNTQSDANGRLGGEVISVGVNVPDQVSVMSVGVAETAVAFAAMSVEPGPIPVPGIRRWPSKWAISVAAGDDRVASTIPGTTMMDLNCLTGSKRVVFCVTHAGARTEVWSVDPIALTVEPLGVLPGWFWSLEASDGIVLDDYAHPPLWMGDDPVRMLELPLEGYASGGSVPLRWRQTLDVAGDWLAVAWSEGGQSIVEVSRLTFSDAETPR